MEFQLNYFRSSKMMLWKCCTQYASKFGKLSSGHRTGIGQFAFQSFQARLQQYVNCERPDIQARCRKGRGTRDQIANICWSIKKQDSSRKTSTSAFLTMPKLLTMWITANAGKFFKRWEYQTILPASWEICLRVKKQQLELDMEQQTGSKLGKEYVKAVYCHPAYLTYAEAHYVKYQAGWSTSWNQDYWQKYQ